MISGIPFPKLQFQVSDFYAGFNSIEELVNIYESSPVLYLRFLFWRHPIPHCSIAARRVKTTHVTANMLG